MRIELKPSPSAKEALDSPPHGRRRTFPIWVTGTLVCALAWGACRGNEAKPPPRVAADALQAHSESLFAIPGVRGTGVTDWRGEEVIVVIVEDRETSAVDRIPKEIEGHRVLVLDEEEIRRLGGL